MDVSKYAGYFHDGALIDIKQVGDKIELFLSSAEMDPEDLQDDIPLDDYDRIKGILHLEGIRKITRNEQPFVGNLNMEHKRGGILDLEITEHTVTLLIDWRDYNPLYGSVDCSEIMIEADKIYWENKPDLIDPYW